MISIEELLAGEPGFPAKLNMTRKSLKTLKSSVANLATWTMSVANGQCASLDTKSVWENRLRLVSRPKYRSGPDETVLGETLCTAT